MSKNDFAHYYPYIGTKSNTMQTNMQIYLQLDVLACLTAF